MIDGICCTQNDKYVLVLIETFSNELKTLIRNNLSSICHGEADVATGKELYSYKNTLIEFLKRYNSKSEDQKKGMIGELLVHIIISELLENFSIVSPFFNSEERNVKKGFDLVIHKEGTTDIWITEVKSGEKQEENASKSAIKLIDRSKNDLKDRLGGDSTSLWLNAINGAKLVMDETNNERTAIISVLQDYGSDATKNKISSASINAILAGSLFCNMDDKIDKVEIEEKCNKIDAQKLFNDVFVIAIQKETYGKVYEFLKGESQNEFNA